jgi:hypothetical protein
VKTRQDCPTGAYGNQTGLIQCFPCTPGNFSATPRQQYCTEVRSPSFSLCFPSLAWTMLADDVALRLWSSGLMSPQSLSESRSSLCFRRAEHCIRDCVAISAVPLGQVFQQPRSGKQFLLHRNLFRFLTTDI